MTDVDSPTGDHALIDIGKLVGLNPRTVTVRTKSRESTSSDSQPTLIPSKAFIVIGVQDNVIKRNNIIIKFLQIQSKTRKSLSQIIQNIFYRIRIKSLLFVLLYY